MNNEIGGYFGLELRKNDFFLHSDGILLNSGKNALRYIVESINDISHIWIPYYTCDIILKLIKELDIPHSFYSINEKLEISKDIFLSKGDYLLFTNYYGIEDSYIKDLFQKYRDQLIVDNAQAWYAKTLIGCKTFYSPRKYVGVPDGGIAFVNERIRIDRLEQDISYDRCKHLLKRYDLSANLGYMDFKQNDIDLSSAPMLRMSKLTYQILSSIDFRVIKNRRISNFELMHNALGRKNQLLIPEMNYSCPMVYPFLSQNNSLKQHLINHKIYVATYWPNVLEKCDKKSFDYRLADNLVAIPIDQRYGEEDMEYMINLICKYA